MKDNEVKSSLRIMAKILIILIKRQDMLPARKIEIISWLRKIVSSE